MTSFKKMPRLRSRWVRAHFNFHYNKKGSFAATIEAYDQILRAESIRQRQEAYNQQCIEHENLHKHIQSKKLKLIATQTPSAQTR